MTEYTQSIIDRIIEEDPRFHRNAYFFMLKCLNYSVQKHESHFVDDETEIRQGTEDDVSIAMSIIDLNANSTVIDINFSVAISNIVNEDVKIMDYQYGSYGMELSNTTGEPMLVSSGLNGGPFGNTILHHNDVLTVYGRAVFLKDDTPFSGNYNVFVTVGDLGDSNITQITV